LDIFQTFLKIGGGKLPHYSLDGYDMMPFFTGKVNQSPRKMYAYMRSGLNALRLGKWKLRATVTVNPQLFNLNTDPGEQYNLAAKKPKIVKQIRQRMQKVAKRFGVKVQAYHYPSLHGPVYGPVDSIKIGNY
jgi:arylsulfatase A-like enzyme